MTPRIRSGRSVLRLASNSRTLRQMNAPEHRDRERRPTSASVSAADALQAMWTERRAEAITELHTLARTIDALSRSPDDENARSLARHTAHQLAGVLGVFGFDQLKARMGVVESDLLRRDCSLDDLTILVESILHDLP